LVTVLDKHFKKKLNTARVMLIAHVICAVQTGKGRFFDYRVLKQAEGNPSGLCRAVGGRCAFKAMKSSGFDNQKTHQKVLGRIVKLVLLVIIISVWNYNIGIFLYEIRLINVKRNAGRPNRYSVTARPRFQLL